MTKKAFLFLILLSGGAVFAQETTGKSGPLKLFFEKVYLHTDRDCYASGDNIWFKAYLANGQSNIPTNSSDNLYVELIDPASLVVSREVIRLDHGTGAGDFKLEDSIPGGNYRLRAYTNWMRNFGDHFIFEKPLSVRSMIAPTGPGGVVAGQGSGSGSGTAAPSGVAGVRAETAHYDIQFLPEGGNLIEGLSSVVAFKATGPDGKGVVVTGRLLSYTGDTILHFQSAYRGMGTFVFTPRAGVRYRAILQYPAGSPISRDLPVARADGYTLSIVEKDTALSIHIQANAAMLASHLNAGLTLAGRHGGILVYGEKVSLQGGQATMLAPKSYFPQGILCMTLYDETMRPHCERLVYIEKNDPVRITVSTDKTSYKPRERVTLNIRATDLQNHPVRTGLSLAVVDRGIISVDPGNIRSYLELESELEGTVEGAAAYFDAGNAQGPEQLDLLLRTQGWRSFLWRSLADSGIHIRYLPEPGITISGKVRETFVNKAMSKMNITLYAPGAKGDKYYFTQSDSAGRYFFDGVEFYGSQMIKINSKNDKGKKGGLLLMDTVFKNPLSVSAAPFSVRDQAEIAGGYAKEAGGRWNIEAKQPFHSILPGVTVTSHSKPVHLRDGSAYVDFGYPQYDFTIGPRDLTYETLAAFLLAHVPGAIANGDDEGIHFIESGATIRPKFVVDKQQNIFGLNYYAVHMDQVIKVTVQHLVGPPSFARGETRASGRTDMGLNIRDVYIIFLSLKPGAYNDDRALIDTEIQGYYEARTFYSPPHDALSDKTLPDVRTTLYWEPYLATDGEGNATVSFYNADPVTTIGVDIEGLTDGGRPVAGRMTYTIKQ